MQLLKPGAKTLLACFVFYPFAIAMFNVEFTILNAKKREKKKQPAPGKEFEILAKNGNITV